jgi:hypothetical protein
MKRLNYRRFFLLALIIALVFSALVGIYMFLIGDFGDTENKILMTTLALAVYSLLGLCSAQVHGKQSLSVFSILGMVFSLFGFIASLEIIWQIVPSLREPEFFMLLTILSFSFAHISLLLLLKISYPMVKYALYSTLSFIVIVAIMLSYVVITHYDTEGLFFRLLGVFAILDVLGSIVTPLIHLIKERS